MINYRLTDPLHRKVFAEKNRLLSYMSNLFSFIGVYAKSVLHAVRICQTNVPVHEYFCRYSFSLCMNLHNLNSKALHSDIFTAICVLLCMMYMTELGFSAVAIADRMGHESIDITYIVMHTCSL
jgi:hypothetical protein